VKNPIKRIPTSLNPEQKEEFVPKPQFKKKSNLFETFPFLIGRTKSSNWCQPSSHQGKSKVKLGRTLGK